MKDNKFTLGYIDVTGGDEERILLHINSLTNLSGFSDEDESYTVVDLKEGGRVFVKESLDTVLDLIDKRLEDQEAFQQKLQEKMLEQRLKELEAMSEVAKCQQEQIS